MKNFLLLLVIVIAAVCAYHWFTRPQVAAPQPDATPAPLPQRSTPMPPRKALGTSSLQTHSLDRSAATPDVNANPLNAPRR